MATTFFIEQFGCRATQADAAAIERQLRDRGFTAAESAQGAGIVVVNTCTVTAAADHQARQAIDAIHTRNPNTRIIVTGCYAQRAPGELAELKGVSWVVGNSHKPQIPDLVEQLAPQTSGTSLSGNANAFVPLGALAGDTSDGNRAHVLTGNIGDVREFVFTPAAEPIFDSVSGADTSHTRPLLKIQDGCDSHCTYCVIPQVRGRSRSLAPDRVIAEIRRLAGCGARETVLSGLDLGSYGRDLTPRTGLASLFERILNETALEQLRVSSIEPVDVTEELIRLFAANTRLAPHFHLPLQSGCDRILAAMRRKYRAEHFARRVERIRELMPHAAIGADVIAGFPGETGEDHERTVAFIEDLPLTYLHVFSFSVRPGTAAAEMLGKVPSTVIARRARELRGMGEHKKAEFRASQAGRTLRVLTLNRQGESATEPWTRAISGNYLDLRVAGRWPANQFLEVEVESAESSNCAVMAAESIPT